jgi:hypothetical protein
MGYRMQQAQIKNESGPLQESAFAYLQMSAAERGTEGEARRRRHRMIAYASNIFLGRLH